MLNGSLVAIAVLICMWSTYLFYQTMGKCEQISYNKKLQMIYCICMITATMVVVWAMCTVYSDYEYFERLKRISLLAVIWPIGYIDYKTYRIPNIFIISGLVCRVILALGELVFLGANTWRIIFAEFVAAGALFLAAILCRIMIKNAIGFGDIKLFILMGIMLGMDGIWSAMFVALLAAFIISVFVLITRKKTKKDSIPFGPALVFGTYISVFLTGK